MIAGAPKRPAMYASGPTALEEVLYTLDGVRDFILSDEHAAPPIRSSYSDFLSERGYSASNFCTRYTGPRKLTGADDELLRKLCEFWQQYLKQRQ